MNNSQVLGILKKLRDEKDALAHARDVLEAYMVAQDTLTQLEAVKNAKAKEITEIEARKLTEQQKHQEKLFEHKKEMDTLAQQRDGLRAEVELLKREVETVRGSIANAISDKRDAIAGIESEIVEQSAVLNKIKEEIAAIRKKFAT